MKKVISLSVLTLLSKKSAANTCGAPPEVSYPEAAWDCPSGINTCLLICPDGSGYSSSGASGKKIRCDPRTGTWNTIDGAEMPSCTTLCQTGPGPEYNLERSSLSCRTMTGASCTPGVDCVHGDECSIQCMDMYELDPQPARDNAISCTCNGVNCKWRGNAQKVIRAGSKCVPQKTVRIINGTDAVRGQDGFAITIGYFGKNAKSGKREWTHFCGGVLLTSQWGVTAAHCQQKRLRALVGEYELNVREGSEVQCRIIHQIRHPDYDFRTRNDIMMIGLRCSRLQLGEYIKPAKLPAPGVDPDVGSDCRICGWGNTDYPVYIPAKKLQCVTLPVIDSGTCNGPDHYIGSIHDKIMCIGNLKEGGKDSCQGDSGGPASCGGIVHGIVMGGLYCAKPNYPGVYTRTNRYISWMQSVISKYSKGSSRRRKRGRGKGRRRG